jgi:uncharacterized protein YbjQ (UPF0145 family)
MTETVEPRMCVWLVCPLRGEMTNEERCPSCGYLTEPWRELAPRAETTLESIPGLIVQQQLLIVTTNDVPGHRITQVHGDVFGLTVRARNYFANLGAKLHTVVGGEVVGYTKLLTDSRNEARARLSDHARALGANAVVAMRFDCNEIGDIMSEIAAYGTAVTIVAEEAA